MSRSSVMLRSDHGGRLAVCEAGPGGAEPVLIWCHANGFAANSYGPFLKALARGLRVIAFDLRGHGESSAPTAPREEAYAMPQLAQDFLNVVDYARETGGAGQRIFGAGHSLGAVVAIAAKDRCKDICGLALVEAAIFPPVGHPVYEEAATLNADRRDKIPGRRAIWNTPEDLCRALEKAPAFAGIDPEHRARHCEAALERRADDKFHLRCAPDVEGFLYGEVARASPFATLESIDVPTLLIAGDPQNAGSSWVSRMQPSVHSRIAGSRLVSMRGVGHLAPLQSPEGCAKLIAEWIEAQIR